MGDPWYAETPIARNAIETTMGGPLGRARIYRRRTNGRLFNDLRFR